MILASKLVAQVFYLYEKMESLFVHWASEIEIDGVISQSSICNLYEYDNQKSMGTTHFCICMHNYAPKYSHLYYSKVSIEGVSKFLGASVRTLWWKTNTK